MNAPTIEMIPAKGCVCSDASITLDVLIRITPPKPEVHFPRSPLNLALVLDRSGSMAGSKKMPYAIDAAAFAVRQLLPTDRVSVTIFDDEVETIVASTLATDKMAIERRIRAIDPRGSTDLHGGWRAGAGQAREHLIKQGLNRVLLLSDGQANVGVTDPNAISAKAREMVGKGVATTTLGVGSDYNEDLMEAIARAGDGNYYYIESPVQLADIFQTELEGLIATHGQKVSLGLEPNKEAGVVVVDVLNSFERLSTGRLMLPSLVVGMPIQVVVRLSVPAHPGGKFVSPLSVRLAWDDLKGESKPENGKKSANEPNRRSMRAELEPLPAVALEVFSERPSDPAVLEQEALLMIARAQREAAVALDRGDRVTTMAAMQRAAVYGTSAAAAGSAEASQDLAFIADMQQALDEGDDAHFTKATKHHAWSRTYSRPSSPRKKPE